MVVPCCLSPPVIWCGNLEYRKLSLGPTKGATPKYRARWRKAVTRYAAPERDQVFEKAAVAILGDSRRLQSVRRAHWTARLWPALDRIAAAWC